MMYLIERLKEPSTWRGLVMIATAAGAHWSPEHQEAVITVGLSLAGIAGALMPDSWKK